MSLINFYKIVCNDSGLIYIGSTIRPIEKRLQNHEIAYRQYLKNNHNFVSSFTIIEKNNYTIELLDSVECNDRKQRDILEALYILNENCINRNQPGRDTKQYYQDNKEKIKEQIKQYYQDNKEKIKEQIKQYQKDNKEQIDRKRNEKFRCPCGGKYTDRHKVRHTKTKKHIDYLATL